MDSRSYKNPSGVIDVFGLAGVPDCRKTVFVDYVHAPASRLYRGWQQADAVRRWWPRPQWTVLGCEVDLQLGGLIQVALAAPDKSRRTERLIVLDTRAEQEIYFAWMDPVSLDPTRRGRYIAHVLFAGTRWQETLVTVAFHYWCQTDLDTDQREGVHDAWACRLKRWFAWATSDLMCIRSEDAARSG